MRPEQKRPSEIDRRQNHNPFEIDMSAERNERSYRGESGYSILDTVNINDEAYGVGDGSNGRRNDGDDGGNNPGYPREPMNDQTTRNHLPPRHSRMRKVLGISGLLGLLYLGGAVNAHKAIGSGCSYAYQGTKSVVADPFTTTPEELVEEAQSTFQRYQKEIESGSHSQSLTRLNELVDDYAPASVKFERMKRDFTRSTQERTLSKSSRLGADKKIQDYQIGGVVDVLASELTKEEQKRRVLRDADKFAPEFTVEERRRYVQALVGSSPEQYKVLLPASVPALVEAIAKVQGSYLLVQELAKGLTASQRQTLYAQLAPTPAPPAKPTLPPPKPAVPGVKPAASTSPTTKLNAESYDKVQQRARSISAPGG